MQPATMTVGELAKRTGLSVRALHYYDEIGLLSPARRTAVGHRRYTAGDIARLQQIVALRQLGFSLEEVRDCLTNPTCSPQRVLELHLVQLRERIARLGELQERLAALTMTLGAMEEVSIDTLIATIEVMKRMERYYTPEQLAELSERRRAVGQERIRQAETEWQELIAQVRAALDSGADPASERVQQLAGRWRTLIQEFTGRNPGIEQALGRMWHEETTIQGLDTGEMRELMDYIGKAWKASDRPA